MNEFEISDLGNMVYFLGMSEKGIMLHQLKYELELLKRYLCNIRPDICYVV